jgi:hypothetical protein
MSGQQRAAVLDTIGRQQAALELAIERGNIGLQLLIWRRMAVLEAALSGDDDGRMADRV